MDQQLSGSNSEELLESFQSIMSELQSKASSDIEEATKQGDSELANQLSVKLNRDYQNLVNDYRKRFEAFTLQSSSSSSSGLYPFPCTLDLDLTVYDGDRDGYKDFESDPNIKKAQLEYEKTIGQFNSRRQLLKTSLKLTPVMAPNIYKIGERCKEILGIESSIEFYVHQNDKFNASVYPPTNDQIYIILTSGLLEKFKDDELTFVIGHELGHTLFNHHKYPPHQIMETGNSYLSPLHAIKLFSWGRSAEISADRIGLICCKDFVATARAFFKLSSGVTTDSLSFQLEEYVKQFVDLSAEIATDKVAPEDWYSTHPFSPLRIKALEIFSRSETYAELTGVKIDSAISEEEMEIEIAQFMSLMEPSHIHKDEEIGNTVHHFLFLSGYLIARADGTVDESELQALGKIVHPNVFSECIKNVKEVSDEQLKNNIVSLSEKLNFMLSPMQKLNVIRDLCLIAGADGETHKNEAGILYTICNLLRVHPDFADQVLHDSKAGLD